MHDLHIDLPFLSERMKIEKGKNLVANLHDKTEYYFDTRNLKQSINHRLNLKKVDRVIKLNQNAWLKSDIDKNTDQKKQKCFWKRFFWVDE